MRISRGLILLLIGVIFFFSCYWFVKRVSVSNTEENTIVDTTKLGTINDSILFHKNVIVIYRDSLTHEIQKIDSISNDSAIKLFRELVNE